MMIAVVLSVAAMFALNVATPGASFILTLRHSLNYGPKVGRFVALGLSTADSIFAVLALSGVTALLRLHAGLASSVGAVGGMWLGALGLALLDAARARSAANQPTTEAAPALSRAYRIGLTAGMVNPQSILFFSTVMLASLTIDPTLLDAAALALTVAVTSLATRSAIATVVSHPLVRERYLARRRRFEMLSGVALLGFGMRLAVKSMYPWAIKGLTLAAVSLHII